jgi:NADH:ubiquinone oxidoreductase subunit
MHLRFASTFVVLLTTILKLFSGHQWLHHVGDATPASVVESEHKFFQSPHTRNTTGVVFTAPVGNVHAAQFSLQQKLQQVVHARAAD